MPTLNSSANPFALLLDPQTVLARIERSERLERLHSRICRPLDKPMIPAAAEGASVKSFDSEIDDASDSDCDESF